MGFFDRIGENISNAPPEAWFTLAQALAANPNVGQGLAQGLAGFGGAIQDSKKKRGLATALGGMASSIPDNQRPIFEALTQYAPETLLQSYASKLFDKNDNAGPFPGTSVDATTANLLVRGQNDPSFRASNEYKLAWTMAQQPKPQVGVNADGQQIITYVPQTLPQGFLPPIYGNSNQQQSAPRQRTPVNAPSPSPLVPMSQETYGGLAPVDEASLVNAPPQAPEPVEQPGQVNPFNSVIIPGTGQKPTEAQTKNQSFFIRMKGAEETLSNPKAVERYTDWTNATARDWGLGFAQSGDAQKVGQAGLEWIYGLLRLDSGATLPPSEVSKYENIYIPQWGDKKELLEQKKISRERATAGMRAGLTPEQIVKAEEAIRNNPNPKALKAQPLPADRMSFKMGVIYDTEKGPAEYIGGGKFRSVGD